MFCFCAFELGWGENCSAGTKGDRYYRQAGRGNSARNDAYICLAQRYTLSATRKRLTSLPPTFPSPSSTAMRGKHLFPFVPCHPSPVAYWHCIPRHLLARPEWAYRHLEVLTIQVLEALGSGIEEKEWWAGAGRHITTTLFPFQETCTRHLLVMPVVP